MNKEKLFSSMEHIDPDLIVEADTYKGRKKIRILLSAAAACLCLAVCAAAVFRKLTPEQDAGEGGPQPAGVNEGVMYSIAVFPAERKSEEVKDAYVKSISEAEARNEQVLGSFLPAELPEGYHFGPADISVTTMNDGTVYRMLRVNYRTGEEPETVIDADGGVQVPDPGVLGDEFTLSIFSFKPDTSAKIYLPDEVTEASLSENGKGFFCVRYENVYIGFEPLFLSIDETVKLVRGIAEQ